MKEGDGRYRRGFGDVGQVPIKYMAVAASELLFQLDMIAVSGFPFFPVMHGYDG